MFKNLLIVLICACIAGIAVSTLATQFRPHIFPFASLDRVFAFAVLGLLAGLAFPRHLPAVLICLTVGAVGLEAAQYLRPTRDPRFFDAIVKVIGAVAGVGMARLSNEVMRRRADVG